MKIKIIGAGSIGNHLSQAARYLGWDVTLCDLDPLALERTKKEIYPGRYGAWDEAIQLFVSGKEPNGGYDIIFIGTPPDSHMRLALSALNEKPRMVFVEKPFCPPALDGASELRARSEELRIPVIVGFDHSVSKSIEQVKKLVDDGEIGNVITHDVEFRESWSGIFNAHPWLAGPHDSYLGFWKRGGGASSEHSHALHLWIYLSEFLGFGSPERISATIEYGNLEGCDYDSIFALNLKTDKGSFGRVIQDVITTPTRKCARIQGEKGVIEWFINYSKAGDGIVLSLSNGEKKEFIVEKTRPDDFIAELKHIQVILGDSEELKKSPLRMELGLLASRVVAAAHRSADEGREIRLVEFPKIR